jgi:hypothetical protein
MPPPRRDAERIAHNRRLGDHAVVDEYRVAQHGARLLAEELERWT